MIVQLDSENADRDIKTALITVLTHTPDASNPMICQGYVALGDGAKNLDGTGGDFSLVITVGGQTVQPSPQTVTFSTATRAAIWTTPFPVPANQQVIMQVKSPNAADSDVDVTAYLYDVSAQGALVLNNLDHLAKTATAAADMTTEITDNSILSRILAAGDTSNYNPTTDSLEVIRNTEDAVTLGNTAHGGAAATLTLLSGVINNTGGVGLSITGSTTGMGVHGATIGLDVDASGGPGVDVDGTTFGMTIAASAGSGIGATGTTAGMRLYGTTNGQGLRIESAGTGHGLYITDSGPGATGYAVYIQPAGGGATHAVYVDGGFISGDAVRLQGGSAGNGLSSLGGDTGHGIRALGGATSGDGINAAGQTLGDGITAVGVGALQYDINADIHGTVDTVTTLSTWSAVTLANGAHGGGAATLTLASATTGVITGSLSGSVGSVAGNVVGSVGSLVGFNVTGTGLTAIPWNAAWDAEVQSEVTDAMTAWVVPTVVQMNARTLPSADYFVVTDYTVPPTAVAIATQTNTTLSAAHGAGSWLTGSATVTVLDGD